MNKDCYRQTSLANAIIQMTGDDNNGIINLWNRAAEL